MNYQKWIRVALGYLAISSAPLGIWGLLAPSSFYENFPGLGRTWIATDGPYNEHLVRDVGALNLALIVLFLGAAWSLSRPLVFTACAAALAWGIPHFVYHTLNTDGLAGSDVVGILSGLSAFVALPLIVGYIATKHLEPTPQTQAT